MKIVIYTGPPELKDEYLRVIEVSQPEQIYGQFIVGVYPDADVAPNSPELFGIWEDIRRRVFSRLPFKKR